MLGRVVEEASGKRLSEFLDERLFKPLKMTDTGVLGAAATGWRGSSQPFAVDPASGAAEQADRRVEAAEATTHGGAGAVSTAADYLRFSQMLLNGGELDGQRILSAHDGRADGVGPSAARAIRQTVQPGEQLLGVQGYSFGIGFRRSQGAGGIRRARLGRASSPGRAMPGTYFWVDPKEQLVGVLMTQAPGPSRPYYRRMLRALTYQAIVD